MDEQRILGGLNPEQRLAAEAVRGPVCILAGAGSGKTTTITHRIANQVASGAFVSEQILAVTFTDKAAGEMRSRLAALGVERVRAATFHSAALAQLSYFGKVPNLKILSSKVLPLRAIGNSLPMPYKFTRGGRPRDRGRVGEEPAADARDVSRRARRARAADPAGADAARVPRLRAAQGGARLRRLRGPARGCGRAVRARRGRARRRPGALSRVHGRRVPGREPAPADAARALARRARRPLRGRRRLPGDLRVHGGDAAPPARAARPLSARDRRPARGELPLDARGARAREPARPEARRGAEDVAGGARRRVPSPSRGRSHRSPTSSTSSSSGFARCTRTGSRSTGWPSSIG